MRIRMRSTQGTADLKTGPRNSSSTACRNDSPCASQNQVCVEKPGHIWRTACIEVAVSDPRWNLIRKGNPLYDCIPDNGKIDL